MGIKTKIPYCDSTWNIVTGCLHGCDFCYARRIAERFGIKPFGYVEPTVLEEPIILQGKKEPYPLGFAPTFHRYRLDEPRRWKKPRTIFVCSMADLFGEWVPDTWIQEVFDACRKAPQHRYLFLTKNPKRFKEIRKNGIELPEKCWIGTSATVNADCTANYPSKLRHLSDNWDTITQWFVSIEPILERFSKSSIENIATMDWVIVGAETGNRKEKVVPEKVWIDEIVEQCKESGTPVFMKESLRELMGKDFKQEYPLFWVSVPADAK